jgi:hypothetical protein
MSASGSSNEFWISGFSRKRYRRRGQLNMCVSVAADAFFAIVAKMTQTPGIAGAARIPLIY